MIFEAEITIYNGKWLENAKAESICLPLLLHGPRDRFFFFILLYFLSRNNLVLREASYAHKMLS